jgi:hypothetical protein
MTHMTLFAPLLTSGFPKGDYNRAPGRKGRVIQDDGGLSSIANKTNKEDIAGLKGAVGGFPGGEQGLQMFLEVG